MPHREGERLQKAATEAFRKAREAFQTNPKPGTPEWDAWQKLFNEAVAANEAYSEHLRKIGRRP